MLNTTIRTLKRQTKGQSLRKTSIPSDPNPSITPPYPLEENDQ